MKPIIAIISKIILLIILVFIGNMIVYKLFYEKITPFYWGSRLMADKYRCLSEDKEINTLFLGSSKVFRQIIPKEFDKTVNSKYQTLLKSFNYGVDGMLPLESYTLYENLLKNKALANIKYAILELNQIDNPKPQNLHKKRLIYWMNFDAYTDTQQINWKGVKPWYIKFSNIFTYTVCYVEKLINLGIIYEASNFHTVLIDRNRPTFKVSNWKDERGVLLLPNKNFKGESLAKINRKMKYMKKLSAESFEKYQDRKYPTKSTALLKKAHEIIEISQKKGIHVIFILSSKTKPYQYEELIPIFNQLPKKHKIINCDSRQYPVLFEVKYTHDDHHVNGKGAKIYTKILAENFVIASGLRYSNKKLNFEEK